jgi:glucose-1-phosphate thymidylyltransferase
MIFNPIQTLVDSGIKDIVIVTGGDHAGRFLNLLRNGEDFGLNGLSYAYQKGNGGIADAIKCAKPFVGNDNFAVILGDGIFEDTFEYESRLFDSCHLGCQLFLKEVRNPHECGIAVMVDDDTIEYIVEKPFDSKSNLAVTGLYFYSSMVFGIIDQIKPSARGELEISDVNNEFIKRSLYKVDKLKGYWIDCGASVDALFEASEFMAKGKER